MIQWVYHPFLSIFELINLPKSQVFWKLGKSPSNPCLLADSRHCRSRGVEGSKEGRSLSSYKPKTMGRSTPRLLKTCRCSWILRNFQLSPDSRSDDHATFWQFWGLIDDTSNWSFPDFWKENWVYLQWRTNQFDGPKPNSHICSILNYHFVGDPNLCHVFLH